MGSLLNIIIGGIELVVGAILLATGIGGALGVKLLLAGALTLITSLLSSKTGRGGLSSSPTYGWDGLGNAQYEGSPVSVIYGENKIKPGIISVNQKTEGGVQVLYLLCLIGAGEITSISQVRLNDTPIESYPGAEATVDRLGSSTQTVIPGFNETGQQSPVSTQLTTDASHTFEMKAQADSLLVSLVYQGGLWAVGSKGGVNSASSTLKIQYKAYGAADSTYTTMSPDATLDKGTWDLDNKQAGTWKTWGSSQAAYRIQIPLRFDGKSGRPGKGRYTVKVTGMGPTKSGAYNTPTVVTFIEITNDNRAYAGYSLLGLKLPASAQLNGIPSISCVVKGTKVVDFRTGAARAFSQNPVLCAYDLITSTVYGLSVPTSKIDTVSWGAMADACDAVVTPVAGGTSEPAYQLDYVLDVQSQGIDHLSQMLATCDMVPVNINRKVYLTQDAAQASIADFEGRAAAAVTSRWNIRDDGIGPSARSTLTASSLDFSQRYNRIRLQYVDRNKDWNHRVVEVRDVYINIGAVSVASFGVSNKIKGSTSGAIGRVTATYTNGARYLTYTQDDGATPFASGETITDLTTGATAVASSAPYVATPDKPLEIQMYGITRRTQAIRRARKVLNDCRSRTVFAVWGGFLGDLNLIPGCVVTVSADHLPWTQKKFTLLSTGFDADGLATFNAREYNSDVYYDNVDTSLVDSLFFSPVGGIPPGARDPGTSTPSDAGSTTNATDSSLFFGGGGSTPQKGTPFGAASGVSVFFK